MVGLTLEETFEFEALDICQFDPQHGGSDEGTERWRELYAKHSIAWDAWMRRSKVQSGEGPPERARTGFDVLAGERAYRL